MTAARTHAQTHRENAEPRDTKGAADVQDARKGTTADNDADVRELWPSSCTLVLSSRIAATSSSADPFSCWWVCMSDQCRFLRPIRVESNLIAYP